MPVAQPAAGRPEKPAEIPVAVPLPKSAAEIAAAKLRLARRLLMAGKRPAAVERFRAIIKDYPQTLAARDARELLAGLGESP